jgi:hypothetical protein
MLRRHTDILLHPKDNLVPSPTATLPDDLLKRHHYIPAHPKSTLAPSPIATPVDDFLEGIPTYFFIPRAAVLPRQL